MVHPDDSDASSMSIAKIRALTREQYDELAFGIIELDRNFVVRNYNRPESLLARRKPEDTIGKHFFRDVAPCTDNREFRGRIEALMAPDAVVTEARFDYVFEFPWGRRSVIIRALRDEYGTCWVFVTPLRSHNLDVP
ncbi:MAG TPA: PAS domain-containing protein [Enhygromyxa sp.]|nr:PAS domain-containing protein [Enhygromyxa sp.]